MSFRKFFLEDENKPDSLSITRLNSFILVVVACILSLVVGYMGLHMLWFPVWANFLPIPPSVIIMDSMNMLIGVLLGFGLGSKVWQKKYESGDIEISKDKEEKKIEGQ